MTTITDYQLLMFQRYILLKLSWDQDNTPTLADNDRDIEMIRKITNATLISMTIMTMKQT